MTILSLPLLEREDLAVVAMIEVLQQRLKASIPTGAGQLGRAIRRNALARAIQGSNTIEGYHATIDDAIAAVEEVEPMDADEATWREIVGYRNAMTYILQLAGDEHFEFHPQLIRSLHFMMLQHNLQKMPGRWRPGDVFVVSEATGQTVYRGPDAMLVPGLIDELVAYLNQPSDSPIMVRAAMAHLNFTMIHPFKDGNGRMARALQTLVFARDGTLSPVFCSIEEWLGRNTSAYYDILARTGEGEWNPRNDTQAWVRFCLVAHFQQAHTLVRRNEWLGRIHQEVEKIQQDNGLHERTAIALIDAAIGLRVRAALYREENELSDVLASRDLRKLVDAKLLIPHGLKRGRYYTGAPELVEMATRLKGETRAEDPYDIARRTAAEEAEPKLI